MLKVSTGVSGVLSQWFYDPAVGAQFVPNAVGGQTLQAPAIAQYGTEFHVVVLGTDSQIYQIWYDSTTHAWSGWQKLPTPSAGPAGGFTSAPAVATYGKQFHVFVRGSSSNHLWHAWYDPSSGWHGWEDITPVGAVGSASAPTVTAYTGSGDRNELHVFYLSNDSSRNIMDEVYNAQGGPANAWGGPSVAEPGPFASAPAACQYQDQLQLWVVGASDHHMDQFFRGPGYGYGGPYQISGDVAGSAPAVAQYTTQFQIWYVMGDVAGTTVSKQAFYDAATGAWNGPWVTGTMTSAPAITTYGTEFQTWWRNTS
jgi:hypothetical protein